MEAQEAGGVIVEDFTIIPNDLFLALRDGEITLCMFQAMVFLHKWANWATGVARKVRAGRMVLEQGEEGFSQRTYQKSLQRLHKAGYITSGHTLGSKKSYPVTINNYRALMGELKDTILNPTEIKDWHDSDDGEGADEGAEGYAESYAERATIQEIHKSLDKSSSGVSQKKHSLPTSLPLSLQREKNPAEQNGDEPDWGQIIDDDLTQDPLTGYARATAFYVAHNLLGKNYSRKYEQFLPQFVELFSDYNTSEDERAWRRGFIKGFVQWVLARPKLATKFLSMKDFFFHFNNQSGSEDGLIHQYTAFFRAAQREEETHTVPSGSPKKKVRATAAMAAIIEDGVLIKNISVDEL